MKGQPCKPCEMARRFLPKPLADELRRIEQRQLERKAARKSTRQLEPFQAIEGDQ